MQYIKISYFAVYKSFLELNMYIQNLLVNIYKRYLAATDSLQTGYLHNFTDQWTCHLNRNIHIHLHTDLIIYIDDRDEIYKAVCATSC